MFGNKRIKELQRRVLNLERFTNDGKVIKSDKSKIITILQTREEILEEFYFTVGQAEDEVGGLFLQYGLRVRDAWRRCEEKMIKLRTSEPYTEPPDYPKVRGNSELEYKDGC